MGEGFIVRKGGVTEEVLRTAVPSINFISAAATSLTFTFKNNEDAQVDLYYGVTTPPTTKITLAANATSSNQTITGLDDTQNFDVYAYAIVTDPLSKKIKSEIVETQAQTLIPTPTITQVSKTDTSITFTVRNNSRVAADVVYDLVTPPLETTLQLAANTTSANQTISGLTASTSFTVFAQAKVAGFADSEIASSTVTTNAPPIVFTAATGGTTQEYNSGGKRFKSHTFNSSGTFTVTTVGDATGDRNKVDYLIIAGGGGGGGAFSGGGGGAGGYRTTLGTSGGNSSAESKVIVTSTSYGITVGGGGAGSNSSVKGVSGQNSSSLGITSTGGGGGGRSGGGTSGAQALNGGSGGGSGASSSSSTPSNFFGTGIAGQGFNGGAGWDGVSLNTNSGGGGGAGLVGQNSANGGPSGNGGTGLSNTLRTGSGQTRAGGGGGGGDNSSPATGGTGGGGNGGGTGSNAPTSGATNTGSGGGGRGNITNATSGNGGSGIVIIRYEIATV